MNTNFYSLWYDPTGNRTRVYRFSSRRSIHSTTDRLNAVRHHALFAKPQPIWVDRDLNYFLLPFVRVEKIL